jgi:Ca2+-binding RTX toxin-like protein
VASGMQAGITVNPAAASRLQVTGFPTSVVAGTAHNFTVTAFDAYGNIASGYRGTATFTSSDNQAMLPANYPFSSSDAGVHTFSATLNTQGTQSITATDTVNAGVTGTESGIMVVSVQPAAGITGPSIGVPGQPLVYTLSASESGLPASTVYSYSVQWGDGSPAQTVSGPSGTQVSHAFAVTSNDSISVTATDPNGHGSVPASASVSITTLAMETDPYNSSLTALYLGGTTGSDNIAITPVAGGGVKVGMNFVNYGNFFPTGHVVVYSQSGNDIIKTAAQTINGVLTYVTVPVLFFAGNGNDILNVSGSSANNVLVGSGGTDRLIGGQGQDILIGGAGQATLQAGAGGDILIGGTTAYDNNAAALAAILAEWSRTDIDYSTRIAHLTGNMSGGLNGSYLLNSSTVHGNGLADNLYGGPGMDWFLAGMMDVFFNKTTGEVVTPV